jgi:hypothetical protein
MPLLLLLAVVVAPEAVAQNRVLQLVLTEDSDPRLTDITRRSMAVELERAGLEVETRESPPTDGLGPDELRSLAESAEVRYVAELRLDTYGTAADFRMALYDGETGSALARLDRRNVPLELEYDTVVARSARSLIAEAGIRVEAPAAQQAPPTAQTADSPEGEDPGFRQIPATPEAPPPVAVQSPIDERGFSVGAAIAPALVTGRASDYLKFGFLAALTGGYRIPWPGMTLELGLLGGVGRLYPEDSASGIDVYLVPFGPSIRVESSSSTALRVGARVSGGAALLSVQGAPQGDLGKIVPYALGGVEVSYRLPRSFVVRLESNYTIFFEEVYPVMAFSPSLAVEWRP